jgi:excinuclease ABC subunit C
MTLINQAKKMPQKPGVYLFIGKNNRVLYVGRATSLRRRVLNYFQKKIDSRIEEMVNSAKRIKYFQTDTILDSVILEANLIKKYWPKYNIRERDDRSFMYIAITGKEYPKPLIVRARELKKITTGKNKIFGPYQSLSTVTNALRIIRRIFPYSTCKPNFGKACFDYQIGLCPGACINEITPKDYRKNINNIILLLEGKKSKLLKKLKKENPEKAKALQHIQDVALISQEDAGQPNFNRIEGYDISHLSGKETVGSMVVFINGMADKSEYRLFKIREAPVNDDLRALEEVLTRRFHHQEWHFPDLVMIDGGKPQIDFLSGVFEEHQINIPLVGISKFGNDKLVFPAKTKKSLRELICVIKPILLKSREEAHRFALNFSRKKRYNKNL